MKHSTRGKLCVLNILLGRDNAFKVRLPLAVYLFTAKGIVYSLVNIKYSGVLWQPQQEVEVAVAPKWHLNMRADDKGRQFF